MKHIIVIILVLSTSMYSQNKSDSQLNNIFRKSVNISESQIKNFLIQEQNKYCSYKSIILTENSIIIDSNKSALKSNFDIISKITDSDELLSGITKFPFFDKTSWIFNTIENGMIYSSITPNNSAIEKYLQDIKFVLDSNLTRIVELRGKIYTKLALLEKDCDYLVYVAKYGMHDNLFLPDTIAYFSKNDTLQSSPVMLVNNHYMINKYKNGITAEKCWEKNVDCSKYSIMDDKVLLYKFFEEKYFEEKNCFLTDEMLRDQRNYDHIGSSIDTSIDVSYKLLEEYPESKIWKITFLDSIERGIDYYAEVKTENNNVKISRIRAFNLPGFYYFMLDSLINSKKVKERKLAQDIILWTSTDDSLMSYFRTHKKDFLDLSLQLDNEPTWDRMMSVDDDSILVGNNKINDLQKDLRVNSVYKDEQYPGIIIYNLGGWLDNEVGYIECKNNCKLPDIFRSRFILIEKITGNWYLYKTT